MLTTYDDDSYVYSALHLGVSGFLLKSVPPEETTLERLTAREHEVLILVAQAHSNTEIARALGIGDETVKTHLSRILAKLGLRDRTQAVIYAAATNSWRRFLLCRPVRRERVRTGEETVTARGRSGRGRSRRRPTDRLSWGLR
ncbi:DNA-binding response regulator [Streptomyces sp. OE57]|uniref:response regulator transcription factor n=1 Tax=Streptomyces lacaronensis TaxID=3379885 RepID=UPI0039B78E6D